MQRRKNQTTGCRDIAYCLVWYFILSHPVYPHRLTNFGQFNLMFNKMALIFLGLLVVFTVSSFEFQQVRLP